MPIAQIDRDTVRQICVSQVVSSVGGAVKELVENALDAGAKTITVKTLNWGVGEISVDDDGRGIREGDIHNVVAQHATSKIEDFKDIESVATFGFRGEALSALCGLGTLSIETKHADAPKGTLVRFAHSQDIASREASSRRGGTCVTVKNLFSTLAVRRKELERNGKREYQQCLKIMQEYCIATCGVRIRLLNQAAPGKPFQVMVSSSGKSLIENVHEVFGMQVTSDLQKANLRLDNGMIISGLVSKPIRGCGRTKTDARYLYIRSRPVDIPAVASKINAAYRKSNLKEKPMFFLNISGEADAFDVNVTPDKRTVLMKGIEDVCDAIYEGFCRLWDASDPHKQDTAGPAPSPAAAAPSPAALKQMKWDDAALTADEEQIRVPSKDAIAAAAASAKAAPPPVSAERFLSMRREGSSSLKSQASAEVRTLDFDAMDTDEPPPLPQAGAGAAVAAKVAKFSEAAEGPAAPPTQQDAKAGQGQGLHSRQSTLVVADDACCESHEGGGGGGVAPAGSHATAGVPGSPPAPTGSASLKKRRRGEAEEVEVDVDAVAAAVPEEGGSGCSCCDEEGEGRQPPKKQARSAGRTARRQRGVRQAVDADAGSDGGSSDIGSYEQDSAMSSDSESVHPEPAPVVQEVAPAPPPKKGKAKQTKKAAAPPQPASIRRTVGGAAEQAAAHVGVCHFGSGKSAEELAQRPARVAVVPPRGDVQRASQRIAFDFGKVQQRLAAEPQVVGEAGAQWSGYAAKGSKCEEELSSRVAKADFLRMRIIGQFNKGFIVVGLGKELFLVDQHASDEKFNFERLKAAYQVRPQPLVQARPLPLPAGDMLLLRDNLEVFTQNGFRFRFNDDEDGDPAQRVMVTAIPTSYNTTFTDRDVHEIIAILKEIPGAKMVRPTRTTAMLASRACRGSVMIGTALDRREMRTIVRHMATMHNPWNCPHGRPTLRHLTTLGHGPVRGSAHPMSTQTGGTLPHGAPPLA